MNNFDQYYQKVLKPYLARQKQFEVKNSAKKEEKDLIATQSNPLCGDEVTLHIANPLADNLAINFQAQACSVVQASAVALCELAKSHSLEQMRELATYLKRQLFETENLGSGLPPAVTAHAHIPAHLNELLGIKDFPARLKCVFLPWSALLGNDL